MLLWDVRKYKKFLGYKLSRIFCKQETWFFRNLVNVPYTVLYKVQVESISEKFEIQDADTGEIKFYRPFRNLLTLF